jgi:15-cis-phytoene synthase
MAQRPLAGEPSKEANVKPSMPSAPATGPSASRKSDQARRDPASVLAASSFSAGVLLLPSWLQEDARRLYYLLRTIDDLVDEGDPRADERVGALEEWALGGCPDSPEAQTLTELSQRYPLSRDAFTDFCKGMRTDIEERVIETEEELEHYCECAGGTVGLMLAGLLGTTSAAADSRMMKLGTAMQRTNILRDIDEDLVRGRVYIAQSTIDRFGFPHPGQREALLRDQICRADALFTEGLTAIPLLRNGRRAMGISGILYREILRQIEREGFGREAGRASVPTWRKRVLIARYALR